MLTAQEDQAATLVDPALLERATSLGRVLFSFDTDLLKEAARCQRDGIPFAGLVYAHPARISIGECITHLELIAKAGEPADMANRVEFLPLSQSSWPTACHCSRITRSRSADSPNCFCGTDDRPTRSSRFPLRTTACKASPACANRRVAFTRLSTINCLRFGVHRPAAIGAPARLITAAADSSSCSQGPGVTASYSTTLIDGSSSALA